MRKSNRDKRHSPRIVRTFDASPEMVYQAWTDPKVVEKWFSPTDFSTPIAEIDLRVGGTYRIGMKSPDGELYVATGVYKEIVSSKKLVFTWRWEGEPASHDTMVTVEFKKSGPSTELIFTHENFATKELAKDHQEGWEGALSKLSLITKEMTDETQIRLLVDDWAKALRAKDADGVVSHHAAGFIHFSLAPPLTTATDVKGLKAWLKAWFSTWQGPIGYEISNLNITVGDGVAFSHSLNRIRGTKTNGEKPEIWFRQTLGFRKIDRGWKITHEHESVPFYMDGSLKAAVDLNP